MWLIRELELIERERAARQSGHENRHELRERGRNKRRGKDRIGQRSQKELESSQQQGPKETAGILEGTWIVTTWREGGEDVLKEISKLAGKERIECKFVISGEKCCAKFGPFIEEFVLKYDGSRREGDIDLTWKEDDGSTRLEKGIYKIIDGELVICLENESSERPTNFRLPGKTLFVLKRKSR